MAALLVTELARGLIDLLYPGRCLVCDAAEDETPFRHNLCTACDTAIRHDPWETCPRCAATVGPHADTSEGCLACRDKGFKFDAAVRLGPYDGRLRDAILRTKSLAGDIVAETLGSIHVGTRGGVLRADGADVVVPIPLHWRRQLTRGYNQAAAFGREVAGGLGVPFAPGWLRRVRPATQHAQPSATARRENVRGAFSLSRGASPAGRTVLLADDVMTTGATLSEAAGVLKKAGAARVLVAVLGRR